MERKERGLPAAGRGAGLALMAAVVVSILAAIASPGVSLIDAVDQTDFDRALDSLGNNPNLGHVTTLLAIVSMLLYARGFSGMFRSIQNEKGVGSTILRAGIGTSLFGWALFVTGMGMRHFAIHLTQRAAEEPAAAETLLDGASGVFIAMTAVLLAFLAVYPVATFLTGAGLAMRFKSVGLQAVVAWILMIAGVAAFAVFQTALHVPSFDPAIMLQTHNVALTLGTFAIFALGFGIFRDQSSDSG